MSEYDRTDQSEFQYSRAPDFSQLMSGMMAGKPVEAKPAPNGFDPHKLMVKKHKLESGEEQPDLIEKPQWPEEDVKALEDYCKKMGIVGFSSRLSPKLVLAQLKQQVGDFVDVPLENRVPFGYEKKGALNSHNCNFPFAKSTTKKSLLNG